MESYSVHDKEGRELVGIETSVLSREHMYGQHTHNKLEISLVKSGRGIYRIDGIDYDMRSNDVFVINNREMHSIYVEGMDVLVNMVIHFEVEFLWDLLGQEPDYRLLDVFFARNAQYQHRLDRTIPATGEIADLMLDVEREMMHQPPYYDLQVKILMKTMLIKMLRIYPYFETNAHSGMETITTSEAYKTKEVLRYIDQNISNDLSLSELAQIACLSPTYFSVLFKRYNGITVTEYITQKRVEHAVSLIRNTKSSLTEIAARCGFNSSTSFYKAFKRATGETPSYFRKNPHVMMHGR